MNLIRIILVVYFLIFHADSFITEASSSNNRSTNKEIKIKSVETVITAIDKNKKLHTYHLFDAANDTIIAKKNYQDINEQLQTCRRQIDRFKTINEFMNLQDSTIFGSKYIDIGLDVLTNQSIDFYRIVQEIHNLASMMQTIENLSVSELIKERGRRYLENAANKIDEINHIATENEARTAGYLSEEQKEFYRYLIVRYNYYNDLLFNSLQSNNGE